MLDFPEHGAVEQLSAHDLIKEGYLHLKTLRWSAVACVEGTASGSGPLRCSRCGNAARLIAIGFSALTLDRYGFAHDGTKQLQQLEHLLGPPIATRGRPVVRMGSPPRGRVPAAWAT